MWFGNRTAMWIDLRGTGFAHQFIKHAPVGDVLQQHRGVVDMVWCNAGSPRQPCLPEPV